MHRLNITFRVFISIVFLLLGLVFLLHTYFSAYRHDINVLAKERAGVAFLRVATQANEAFTDYRILLYHADAGDKPDAAAFARARERVDAAYAKLSDAYAAHGKDLGLEEEYLSQRERGKISFAQLQAIWHRIAAARPDAVEDSWISDVYVTFIALSDHVTETSAMIMDSDLPSYSLMDASANHITHAMNRLFGFSGAGYDALMRGEELPHESKLWAWDMSTYITGYNMVKVGGSVENAFYYDKPHASEQPYMEKTRLAYERYMQSGLSMSEDFAKASKGQPVDPQQFVTDMLAYRAAMYDLWYQIADQLAVRLELRLEKKEGAFNRALLVAVLCSVFALGFFILIMRDMTRSFKGLENAMDRIAQGQLDTHVPYQAHEDEIGHMARSLERLRQSYWWLRDE